MSGQSCGIQIDLRFGTNIYLDVSEVDAILFKVADELSEILFSWHVVTTVRPYSLKKCRQHRQLYKFSEGAAPFFIV
jgi:hypothetical protein